MKNYFLIFFVIICVITGITACEPGEIEVVMPELPDGITAINNLAWDRITTDDNYVISNNPWNQSKASTPYAYNIFKGVSEYGNPFFGWQWFWNNSNDSTVLAYPQVFCGYSPFGPMGTIGHTPGFPYTIEGHEFHTSFTISMETFPVDGRNIWNLAFDIWVLNSHCDLSNFGPKDIKSEIMVWLASKNSGLSAWLGKPADSPRINGYSFDYYYYANQADGNGPDGYHTYTAFSSQSPVYSSPDFDLTPFITYLVNNGVLSLNDYIATIELGNEITIGSGQTVIQDYAVMVQ